VLRRQAADKNRPPRRTAEILDRLAVNAPTFTDAMRLLLALPTGRDVVLPSGAAFRTLAAELEAARVRRRKVS